MDSKISDLEHLSSFVFSWDPTGSPHLRSDVA